MTHDWVEHTKDAKHCSECGTPLVIGPIVHKTNLTGLDPYQNDVIAGCSCGWRKDFVWTEGKRSHSREKAVVAVAEHVADAPHGPRCPNEPEVDY